MKGSLKIPGCALVQFTTLLDLAQNETNGLMRGISQPAVSKIEEDMARVGIVKAKFGRPTINLSRDMSDDVYHSLFHPLLPGDIQLINDETNFIDLQRTPVFLPTEEIKPFLNFTDGRHRVIACSKVAPTEELNKQFVVCFITTKKEAISMKQDSFRKSEVMPLVFDSIHDVLVCLPQWESGNTSQIRRVISNILRITDTRQAEKIELLHFHMFTKSRALLDARGDTNLFSRENVLKSGSAPFFPSSRKPERGNIVGTGINSVLFSSLNLL